MVIDLTQMEIGKFGIIEVLHGGQAFIRKAQSMGIRPGKRIKKVSSHFWRGPQTIEIDRMRLAIGFGMAKKIFVQVKR
ncbi:ferrous iron transport protein A [Candidatus Omnitrophota bacterium]